MIFCLYLVTDETYKYKGNYLLLFQYLFLETLYLSEYVPQNIFRFF